MKVLRVGDPHITVRNMEDSQNLLAFIAKIASERNVDQIEFLGDLMHTHAVIRVEVLEFWRVTLLALSSMFNIVILVGNHDQPGSKEKEQEMNALNIFKSNRVTVVNKPMIINNIGYMPYMSDKDTFISEANGLFAKGAHKLLIAHQNFTVPLYSDLIDPNSVLQENIITGHIHEQKQMGKVFQVGTPKWDTLTDANEDKGVWIYEHNEDGSVKSREFVSTKGIVTAIESHKVVEGQTEPVLTPGAKNYVELIGSSAWIEQMKKKYKGLASIKARPSDRKNANVSKDKAQTLFEYLETAFSPIDGVSKDEMKEYLKEVINV